MSAASSHTHTHTHAWASTEKAGFTASSSLLNPQPLHQPSSDCSCLLKYNLCCRSVISFSSRSSSAAALSLSARPQLSAPSTGFESWRLAKQYARCTKTSKRPDRGSSGKLGWRKRASAWMRRRRDLLRRLPGRTRAEAVRLPSIWLPLAYKSTFVRRYTGIEFQFGHFRQKPCNVFSPEIQKLWEGESLFHISQKPLHAHFLFQSAKYTKL